MCWNFYTNLLVGAQLFMVGFYKFHRNIQNDRREALVMMSFATTRFVEALLWWELGPTARLVGGEECSSSNKVLSSFGLPLLFTSQMLTSKLCSVTPVDKVIKTPDPHHQRNKTIWYLCILIVSVSMFMTLNNSCTVLVPRALLTETVKESLAPVTTAIPQTRRGTEPIQSLSVAFFPDETENTRTIKSVEPWWRPYRLDSALPAFLHILLFIFMFRPQSTAPTLKKWVLQPSVLVVIGAGFFSEFAGPTLCTVSSFMSLFAV